MLVVLKNKFAKIFSHHFEWVALSSALLAMGLMNPYVNHGPSWCLLERAGLFCPGKGLGHAIAFTFRGDWHHAVQANVMGPIAIVIILARIGFLLKQNVYRKSF